MKRIWIDNTFLVLAILFLASMLLSALWRFLPVEQLNQLLSADRPTWLVRFYWPIVYLVGPFVYLSIHIAIAVWLFVEARRRTWYCWFWTLMGLVFGPLALAVFYLININRRLARLESQKTDIDQDAGTPR